MYTFSSKLKTFSLALMIIGALGVTYSFLATPNSVEDVKEMLKESHGAHEKSMEQQRLLMRLMLTLRRPVVTRPLILMMNTLNMFFIC